MTLTQLQTQDQPQRVQVEFESDALGKRVKILLENHDHRLGWYSAGSLSLALHQLPLLEQAIEEMRRCAASDEAPADNIIPFPGTSPCHSAAD